MTNNCYAYGFGYTPDNCSCGFSDGTGGEAISDAPIDHNNECGVGGGYGTGYGYKDFTGIGCSIVCDISAWETELGGGNG